MSLDFSTQFITDPSGEKKFVVLSFEDWEKIMKRLQALQFMDELKESIQEVKQARKQGKKLKTLNSFLNEG